MNFLGIMNKANSRTGSAGRTGEERASEFLRGRGLRLIQRNFNCRWGELDLVMKDGATLVIVEVRLRASAEFGQAYETVNYKKQQKIIRTTKYFQQQMNWWGDVRFDVVAVTPRSDGEYEIEHIQDAFGT